MLSSLVTSAGIAMAFNLVATASRRSTLRDATITSAPSRLASSAVARPMPDEPPTTTTFLPASIMWFPRYFCFAVSDNSQFVIARSVSDEAIQSSCVALDCFAPLAMTGRECRPELRLRRLKSGSNARLALPRPRQLPDPGARGVDVGGAIDVDQIGFVGGDALANGFAEVAGAVDAHALDAAGTRHGGEVRIVALTGDRIVEVGGEFTAPEIAALQAADRGIGVVVPDHPDHGQIIFDRRSQYVGMHEEGAIAAYRHAGPIGGGEFRTHHAGNAKAHRAKTHRADQRVRPLRLAEAQQPIVVHADIADQDRILGQRFVDFERSALRIDRRGVVGKTGSDELVPFLAIGVDLRQPLFAGIGALAEVGAAVEFGMNLPQEGAHIGHQA